MSPAQYPSSPRQVARSAFRAGGLVAVLVRPSLHARTGAVVELRFSGFRQASRFAALWSRRVGVSVRLSRHSGAWSVSVPLQLRHSRFPVSVCQAVPVSGGVRGLRRCLAPAGLWF
jgi:hypothetical protein